MTQTQREGIRILAAQARFLLHARDYSDQLRIRAEMQWTRIHYNLITTH